MSKRIAIVLAALTISVSAAACGSTGHYVGGVVVHHIANHLSPKHQRLINKVFCLYHGHRVYVDLKTHHYIAAGANAYSAYHACKKGFGK